ncbi:hypothetical protein TNCV_4291101 [Trichonephila clavipes]|nr:hypothetical protein TNCV_4291101 [Trichonephila clavipes]
MCKLGKTKPLPGHSSIGSIYTRKHLRPGVPPSCLLRPGHLAKTRHGTYLDSVSSGTPKRGTTSRLTGAGSLLPPVYSEAWAKELSTLDKEIENLIGIESLEEEIVTREEYRDKFIIWKIRAERYVESVSNTAIQNSVENQPHKT